LDESPVGGELKIFKSVSKCDLAGHAHFWRNPLECQV
jgi:hypothetical protein